MLIDSHKIKEVIEDCYTDHEHYSKYRSYIDETELKNSETTDKAVLTLSSASLALLLTLSKDIDLAHAQTYSLYLKVGWFVILSAMSCVLASMFISGVLHARHRTKVDKILMNRAVIIEQLQRADITEGSIEADDKLEFNDEAKLSVITRILHGMAPILLVLGIIASGQFFLTHISKGNIHEQSRQAHTNAAASTATETTNQGGKKIMSEQRQNNSVPPPAPAPKAPPVKPTNSK